LGKQERKWEREVIEAQHNFSPAYPTGMVSVSLPVPKTPGVCLTGQFFV